MTVDTSSLLAVFNVEMWLGLLALVAFAILSGHAEPLMIAYVVAAGGLVGLIGLDCYWIGKCRQSVDFY